MEKPLFDRVETQEGNMLVTTKTRFYGVFTRPRTYVVPEGFGGPLGFQARYNTSDPQILVELHEFWVERIIRGEFQALLAGAKHGRIALPPELERLGRFIIGFNA